MDLAIILDHKQRDLPLHQQLYSEIRQAILTNRLTAKQKLPSTRSLAQSLGISRTTVTSCYEQLKSEGYIDSIPGAGTFVCTQIPDDLLHANNIESKPKQNLKNFQLSTYAQNLATTDIPGFAEPQNIINFRYGRPAFDKFPMQTWRKLLLRQLQLNNPKKFEKNIHHQNKNHWLDYSIDLLGYAPLRAEIAKYLARSRAVNCHPEQILLVNGTQQALYLIMRLLINPGDTIAIENPGYLSARKIFLTQAAQLIPIAVDAEGLIVNQLNHYTHKNPNQPIKLIYVTPSHQFPTGSILSLQRRWELLTWAQQNHALIIEDDYDSEYRYGDKPIPALQGLAESDLVLYVGTFSKVLFPSLRIGYLVLPTSLIPIFSRAKWLSDRHLPLLEQYVLTDFIREGHLEKHMRKMRSHYNQRRQVLVNTLSKYFRDRITIYGEKAGIHLMVKFDTHLSNSEISDRAAKIGIGMCSAQPHYLENHQKSNTNTNQGEGEFIFGYSELDDSQIETGISQLAKIIN